MATLTADNGGKYRRRTVPNEWTKHEHSDTSWEQLSELPLCSDFTLYFYISTSYYKPCKYLYSAEKNTWLRKIKVVGEFVVKNGRICDKKNPAFSRDYIIMLFFFLFGSSLLVYLATVELHQFSESNSVYPTVCTKQLNLKVIKKNFYLFFYYF